MDKTDLGSIVIDLLKNHGEIDLNLFKNKKTIPHDYHTLHVNPKSDDSYDMCDALSSLYFKITESGYESQELFHAVYEAVLNAFQHGNGKDPSKKICVGYKATPSQIDIMVEDEGRMLDKNFIPFVYIFIPNELSKILEKRKTMEYPLNFYKFSKTEPPKGNFGQGIIDMHCYVDSVKFYSSKNGGLIAHLTKKKQTEMLKM